MLFRYETDQKFADVEAVLLRTKSPDLEVLRSIRKKHRDKAVEDLHLPGPILYAHMPKIENWRADKAELKLTYAQMYWASAFDHFASGYGKGKLVFGRID